MASLGSLHILVVDNDKVMVTLVQSVLTGFGFKHISTASNGVDALDTMMNRPRGFDILITDWEMEPMNGMELVQKLRRDRTSPNRMIPTIMLTGKAEKHHVEIARDIGVTEFLAKPFSPEALRQRIVSIVDHPREFVLAEEYVGPSRRRKQLGPPADVSERRSAN